MMLHNLVKYFVQNRFRLWDIKIINFKQESCPDDLLEICYFCISRTKSSWTRYFTRLCIIILSTCVIFLINLDDFFIIICMSFYKNFNFHQICFHYRWSMHNHCCVSRLWLPSWWAHSSSNYSSLGHLYMMQMKLLWWNRVF